MTPDEAKECVGKEVFLISRGLVKGYKKVKILNFFPNERTAWGKGVVNYINYDAPSWYRHKRVSCCITQIDLYHELSKRRRRKEPSRKRKRKTSAIEAQTTRKRQRKSKGKRRRRS